VQPGLFPCWHRPAGSTAKVLWCTPAGTAQPGMATLHQYITTAMDSKSTTAPYAADADSSKAGLGDDWA